MGVVIVFVTACALAGIAAWLAPAWRPRLLRIWLIVTSIGIITVMLVTHFVRPAG